MWWVCGSGREGVNQSKELLGVKFVQQLPQLEQIRSHHQIRIQHDDAPPVLRVGARLGKGSQSCSSRLAGLT